ncbi:MAG: UDP-N-acetylmuramoylalanine--D-glutamate ligase [Candidatus Binatia bacterium]|nr:MAG: UDP-N-acetylmuramoylalanine--D-glutamate ligase [Candidatus Binatia bacterium]
MNLSGKLVLVLGAGRTGRAVARFLRARRSRVRIAERSEAARQEAARELGESVVSDEDTSALGGVDLVVPSPGVPKDHPLLRSAVRLGVPVWSEIELAYRFLPCPILAVTGTNGKSTTTSLLGEMARRSVGRAFVGGNLGVPLVEALLEEALPDLAVVEVSSFQLEWVRCFRPALAVFLNLSPDHLDRYATFEEYAETKGRLVTAAGPESRVVLNRDDPGVWAFRNRTYGRVVSFGRDPVEFGAFLDGGDVVYRGPGGRPRRFSLRRTALRGAQNEENVLAAVAAACAWGFPDQAVQEAIDAAAPLPHRAEFVAERAGVRFVDDSKATNVGAVAKLLSGLSGEVVLLLGGYDKGADFRLLLPLFPGRVRHVVAFGAAGPEIARQLGQSVPLTVERGLEDAVRCAARLASSGQTVLLSPGCASFDEFSDYAERGRRFRQVVEALG